MRERFAGRFLLLRRLGRGGMGEVFLVRDTTTGAECALKRLPGRVAGEVPQAVHQEFEAATRVRHPAVVAVHELGVSPEGVPFYTMEYVPGLPADEAIAPGDWSSLFFIGAEVAHGLEILHAAGVAHGDLKPSNLLVAPGDRPGALPRSVRLLDFGLAALVGLTSEGHAGTPGYAAPEVVAGQAPSPASDLYGLGATLYTMAAARPPFEGEDVAAVLRRQRSGPPSTAPLESAGAPATLVRLILRLMAPDPAERPRDARDVRQELESIHPAARRPLSERIETAQVVGREREMAWFEAWWKRSPPRPPLVILSAMAGTGKSALLGEIGTRAALAARPVIRLSCGSFEGSGSIAVAILRRLAAEAGLDPEEELAATKAHGLRESDYDELASRASDWAGTIAQRSGSPLVILDDAERLDAPSRAWIRRVITREACPIGWVWARRPGEREEDDEQVLVVAGLAERLELGPLDRAAVTRLAATRLHEMPPPALSEFLWSRSGGHPGLAVELLRAAAVAGAVAEGDVGLRLDERALAEIGAPPDYETSMVRRWEALEEGARRLAEVLAVWGTALAPEPMRALLPEAGEEPVVALLGSGLATRTDAGEVMLWPPLLGERLARELPEGRRRDLHRAALAVPGLNRAQRFRHLRGAGDAAGALEEVRLALEEGPADGLVEAAAELAEREVPEQAARWLERAGRRLMQRGLFAAAVPRLQRSLELDRDGQDPSDAWADLCRAAYWSGQFDLVERILRDTGSLELTPSARARILADAASGSMMRGLRDEAAERAAAAQALAAEVGAHEAEGTASQVLGYLATLESRLDVAESLSSRAAEAFARAGRPSFAHAVGLRSLLSRARSRLDESERVCREAVESARASGDRLGVEEHQMQLGVVLIEAGKWEDALRAYEESARLAVEDVHLPTLATAQTNRSILEGLIGNSRGAVRHAREAVRSCRAHRPRTEHAAWRSLAQAYRVAGRYGRAARVMERAGRIGRAIHGEEASLSGLERARIEADAGRWKAARELAEAAMVAGAGHPVAHAFATLLAGRAALRLGDLQAVAARVETVEAGDLASRAPYVAAQLLQLRAEIELGRGRWSEGSELGHRALAAFAALPAPPDRGRAALDLARLAPATPESTPRVVEWLELAAATFDRLGDRRGREAALTLLVERLKQPAAALVSAGGDRGLIERVSWLLHSITDLAELTQRAMQMAVEQLDAERGVLLMQERETAELRVMAEHGAVDATTRNEAMRFSRRVVRRVTESGGAILIEDAWSDPRARSESIRNLQLRSIVCVPLYLGGAVIGAVYLDDSRRPHQFGEAERGMLEGFAHLISVAIEKARGHEEIERLKEILEGENLSLRQEVGARFQFQNLIGTSSEMRRVMALIEPAARTPTTVLIHGETGTGKELVARIIHHSGPRRKGPFVAVNCGAVPEPLLESELFGILSNVATNVRARDGRFVQANGGTLFLDEIGEMPPAQQVALLSAIANREVTPVGGGKPIPVDVRIVAASNKDLRRMVEEQRFRDDLYYRLAVLEIEVPPLRERKSDIPELARHFMRHIAAVQQREVPKLSPDFMAVLMQSDWRGNVRELLNYVERVMAMNPGNYLRPDPLPKDLQERVTMARHAHGRGLIATVGEVERRMVTEALQKARGNQSQAARLLGLTEQSLRYRLRKYGLVARENRRTRQS